MRRWLGFLVLVCFAVCVFSPTEAVAATKRHGVRKAKKYKVKKAKWGRSHKTAPRS